MGRPKRKSPRVTVRGIIPHGHPLNPVLTGQQGAQALGSLLELALDGARVRDVVPNGHPLSAVLAGNTGIRALDTLIELALEGLRAREHPPTAANAIAAEADKRPQTGSATTASRAGRPIPKQLLNFRPRRKAE
jgi:hypothetical protein